MSSIWTVRRSATDAKLTGLCGGVARYWGIDPVLVRVGAVLLALSGGIGLVLYVAGWLLVPVDGRPHSTLGDLVPAVRRWPKEAWVVVVVVVCLIVFAVSGFTTPFGFGPAIVLALIWYFGYYKNRSGKKTAERQRPSVPPIPPAAPNPYAGPATPFTEAADAWRQRMAEVAGHAPPPAPPTPSAARVAPPVPTPPAPTPPVTPPAPTFPLYADAPTATDPRLADPEAADRAAFLATPDPAGLYSAPEPASRQEVATAPSRAALARTGAARRLRLVGLVVLGLTLAGLGIADAAGVAVTPAVYVGAALLVVGLTLVAATWFGRARGILPVGIVLLLALLSVTVVDVPSRSTEWSRSVAYTSAASLPTGCETLDVGSLTVDLSQLDVSRSTTFCAHVDFGRLVVLTPADANVTVRYAIDAGAVSENGVTKFSGTELTGALPPPRTLAGRPTLTLDLSADVGELQVQR